MSDTKSFESIVNAAMEKVHGNYEIKAIEVAGILGTLSGAHDREMRDMAQQEYHRGYELGRHSMDAEHRAVVMRLRQLPLDGGSVENVFNIARAVYHNDFGWAANDCAALRDELVRLMGGVSEPTIKMSKLNTALNHGKAEKPSITEAEDDTCGCASRGACDADCGCDSGEHEEVEHGGAAHDSGADTGCGGCCGDLHVVGVTYDVLGNEQRKAIASLQAWEPDKAFANDNCGEIQIRLLYQLLGLGGAMMMDGADAAKKVRDRLIHLLGGDKPSGIKVMNSYEQRIEKLVRQRDEARDERDELQAKLDAMTYYNGESKIERLIELILKDACIEKLQAKLDAITEALHGEP